MSQATEAPTETRLTFGIRLEFLLGYIEPPNPDPHPSDPRPINQTRPEEICTNLVAAFRNLRIPAWTRHSHTELPTTSLGTCWIIDATTDLELALENPETPSPSHYSSDSDIEGPYKYRLIQLQSPAYHYSSDSIARVHLALATLLGNYRIKLQYPNGLRVQIGNGQHEIEAPKVRNIIAMAITYERQLALMHPPREDAAEDARRESILEQFRGATPGQRQSRVEILERVLRGEEGDGGEKGLRWVISGCGNELGTLDPVLILHWLHVCVRLVEKGLWIKGEGGEQERFEEKMRRDCVMRVGSWDRDRDLQRLSTTRVLMWLACPVQAYYYGVRLQQQGEEVVDKRISDMEIQWGDDEE